MEDQKISVELLSRLCRICVLECSHMSPLFARDFDVSRRLNNMLMSCTNLKILEADGFPNSICNRCVDELKSAYEFQQRCESADRYYKQLRLKSNSDCTETEAIYNKRPNYDYIEMLENNLIVFRCRECCQAFSTTKELKNHKQIHSMNEITEVKRKSLNVTEPVIFTEGENEEEHLLEMKQEEEINGEDEHLTSSFFEKFNNCNTEENSAIHAIMQSEIKDEVSFTDTVVKEENIQYSMSNLFFEHFYQKVIKKLEVVSIPKERKKQHGGSLTAGESIVFTERKIENNSNLEVMKEMNACHDNNVESSSSDDQDEDYSPSDDSDSDYFPSQTHQINIGIENQKHRNTRPQHRLLQKLNSRKTDRSRIFQCADCGQEFDKSAVLQEHCLLHRCRVYIQRLTCFDNPKGHLHSNDCGQRLFKCDVCEKSYAHSIDLRYHERVHNTNNCSKCDMCKKSFTDSNAVRSHKLMYNKCFKCCVCEKSFASRTTLSKHKWIHYPTKRFKCDVCEKQFTFSSNLYTHKFKHNANKRFKCDVCEKQFTFSSNLYTHKFKHNANKRFKCDVCEKQFKHSSSLYTHKFTHDPNKRFKCDVCEKLFAYSTTLKSHKLIHHADKRLQCDVCEKLFACSFDFRRHQLAHNTNKPFKCDVCEKQFKYSTSLYTHKFKHNANKRFKCDVCEKQFKYSTSLYTHKFKHNANKRFKCDVCEKQFKYSTSLYTHKFEHNANKRFKCDVCEKLFVYSANLKSHKLRCHADKGLQCDV